jgi:hypothetical protein
MEVAPYSDVKRYNEINVSFIVAKEYSKMAKNDPNNRC